ncbi:MAG: hypothetical protein ACK5M3_03740 [Dysgonomonas sp.]
MKVFHYIICISLLLSSLYSCQQKGTAERESKQIVAEETHIDSTLTYTNPRIIHKKDFEKILKDPNTPQIAIEIYNGTYKAVDDSALALLRYLEDDNYLVRWFYFRVITDSYKYADGAYAEGLGGMGAEYTKSNPCEFADYFNNKEIFNDNDLVTWANIVISELRIDDETGNEATILEFNEILKNNSKNCEQSQRKTIDSFCEIMKKEWKEYAKNNHL